MPPDTEVGVTPWREIVLQAVQEAKGFVADKLSTAAFYMAIGSTITAQVARKLRDR